MKGYEASLKDVETWLGDDHNLVILRERLVEEKPRRWVRRIGRLWEAWEAESKRPEKFEKEVRQRGSGGMTGHGARPRAPIFFCCNNGNRITGHVPGLAYGWRPSSSGSGSTGVPFHHSCSGPSLKTAKCRCGASGEASPVEST